MKPQQGALSVQLGLFPAKLTNATLAASGVMLSGQWLYDWTEQAPDAGNAVYSGAVPPRQGAQSGGGWAVELNNTSGGYSGSLVWLRPRGNYAGQPVYEFNAGLALASLSGETTGYTGTLARISTIACQSGNLVATVQTDTYVVGDLISTTGASGLNSTVGVGLTSVTGATSGQLLFYNGTGTLGAQTIESTLDAIGGLTVTF